VKLAIVTAVISAFLDNVTTVLLVAPVTLLITEELKVSPIPTCSPRSWRRTSAARRP